MPKQRRKGDLPTRTCATCGRPFAWRRKWARVWNEVRHCSERCRRARRSSHAAGGTDGSSAAGATDGPAGTR
ncbi:MAG: DUF2256 domain-containing protein [Paracoccaceae bacterium]|nr:DUF2256 domain-containing protein [Paracoccaceae bacterium]